MNETREVILKALFGSHNYNLNTETSDKDYSIFVCPTFEELYYGNTYNLEQITDDEDLFYYDIRKLPKMLTSNVKYLELLFSKEIAYNDKFEKEILELLSLKNSIVRANADILFKSCYGIHKKKISLLHKYTEGTKHLEILHGYNTKEALHSYRVLKVIVDYVNNGFTNFEKCLRYDGEDLEFMLSIKNGELSEKTFLNFMEHYISSNLVHCQNKIEQLDFDKSVNKEIDKIIYKIVEKSIIGGKN